MHSIMYMYDICIMYHCNPMKIFHEHIPIKLKSQCTASNLSQLSEGLKLLQKYYILGNPFIL